MYEALSDGEKASAELDREDRLAPEFGNSRALTYAWIRALAQLGHVEAKVTADVPTYAAFHKKGNRTYVAYNPGEAPATVTFSDGYHLSVPAKQVAQATAKRPHKHESQEQPEQPEEAAPAPKAEEPISKHEPAAPPKHEPAAPPKHEQKVPKHEEEAEAPPPKHEPTPAKHQGPAKRQAATPKHEDVVPASEEVAPKRPAATPKRKGAASTRDDGSSPFDE
jgi:hypothetical protein